MQQLIFDFVYDLESSAKDPEKGNQISYYFFILSRDNKFIKVVEKIYENRHKGFERGYRKLRNKN